MVVEDSGCQDWHWDGVRSYFQCVIMLSVPPPLLYMTNYTTTMRRSSSCGAAWVSPAVKAPPAIYDSYSMCEAAVSFIHCSSESGGSEHGNLSVTDHSQH